MTRLWLLLAVCLVPACASVQAPSTSPALSSPSQAQAPAKIDLSTLPLAQFAHADLQSAAAYAMANGHPERSAVWLAIDGQVTACQKALSTLQPTLPTGTVGAFTAFEMAAEAVGTGIPAGVKLACEPVTLPSVFSLPKL